MWYKINEHLRINKFIQLFCREILKEMGCVGVKQRAGCLPYVDDPHGFRTLLAQTLSSDSATSWQIPVIN